MILNLFFSIQEFREGYSADRMKRALVRGIAILSPLLQIPKNCALLHMDVPMDGG